MDTALWEDDVRHWLYTAAVVVSCALIATWFFTTYEKITDEKYTGYIGEARANEFLAADLLLNETGYVADSLPSLKPTDWLPDSGDTIVSRLSGSFAIGDERDALVTWVGNGGHLVLFPSRQSSPQIDEFLGEFGVAFVEIALDDEEDAAESAEAASGDEEQDFDYRVDLEYTPHRIEIGAEDFQGATLEDGAGIVAARQPWGIGYVSLIADGDYFVNEMLDTSDHARLLLDTVAGHVETGTVWFVYDADFPSLFAVIWDEAPFAVLGTALTLLLGIWSVIPKFGPAILAGSLARRSIIEHVRAAGHFAWRHRAAQSLAGSSTTAVLHDAESKHPGINRLPPAKQARQIARMTGLTPQAALDALTPDAQPRQREFTHHMQTLQRIRKQL